MSKKIDRRDGSMLRLFSDKSILDVELENVLLRSEDALLRVASNSLHKTFSSPKDLMASDFKFVYNFDIRFSCL